MKPIYRYRYPPYLLYRTDTDIPHIPHTDFFHTDTDTGYRYLVSVPGIDTWYGYHTGSNSSPSGPFSQDRTSSGSQAAVDFQGVVLLVLRVLMLLQLPPRDLVLLLLELGELPVLSGGVETAVSALLALHHIFGVSSLLAF